MDNKIRQSIVKQVIFYLLLLFFWQFLVMLKIWPKYLFPSPLKVAKTLIYGFKNRTFIIAILISLKRIVIGYGVSIVAGTVLAVLMRKFAIVNETLGKLVIGIQTLPSICWYPLALLWFGLSQKTIIFIAVMGSLFSITISVYSGIKNTPQIYLQAARNMGARQTRMLWWVLLPAAAPTLVVGLKQGWSFAWRSLMAGELLFVSLGLGHLLMMGRELNDMSKVMAVMFIIMAISIIVDKLIFGVIELKIRRRWGT
jgi:NitT/TauT family transport system permease protein